MTKHDDIIKYNRASWNAQVKLGNRWTIPVTSQEIAAARNGDWSIVLTPRKPVPAAWFPDFSAGDYQVLCLAGGGGQQAPILAAAGANVTVFDNSDAQIAQDEMVAKRNGLDIATVAGDMTDLSCFAGQQFDLIFHPCSNCFVENVLPVWSEALRVLKPGGQLLSGFTNPTRFLFDDDELQAGKMRVAYEIPYSDLTSIDAQRLDQYTQQNEPRCFGHSLDDQIAGQISAGFAITGFYEDSYPADDDVLSNYIDCFIATKATKAIKAT